MNNVLNIFDYFTLYQQLYQKILIVKKVFLHLKRIDF